VVKVETEGGNTVSQLAADGTLSLDASEPWQSSRSSKARRGQAVLGSEWRVRIGAARGAPRRGEGAAEVDRSSAAAADLAHLLG